MLRNMIPRIWSLIPRNVFESANKKEKAKTKSYEGQMMSKISQNLEHFIRIGCESGSWVVLYYGCLLRPIWTNYGHPD